MKPVPSKKRAARPALRLLLPLLLTGAAASSQAQDFAENSFRTWAPASVSYGKVISLPVSPPGPVQISNATSVMQRSHNGVSVTLRTTGLEPDTVYTLWMLVFNRPDQCVGIPMVSLCNPGAGDITRPGVEGSVLWTAGGISDSFGQIRLSGSVFADGSTPGLKLFGPGLEDPFRPEIHMVLKRHGPAVELATMGLLNTALTTPGGCVDACVDVQATSHLPTLHFRR